MTSYETVSVITFDAAALRTVIPVDAHCVRSTRIFDVTWTTTHVSNTGFHEWTFVIRGALNFDAGSGQRVARNSWWTVLAARDDVRILRDAVAAVAYRSGGTVTSPLTLAKFDAHRFVVLDLTLLPGFARITGQARVDTRSVDARPFRRALVAVSTSNFFQTSLMGISDESRRAEFTDRFMVFNKAWCVVSTLSCFARVDTLIVSTGQISWTSAISQANRERWTTVLHTYTGWFVIHYETCLIFRAGWSSGSRRHTRIQTLSIDTCHIGSATVIAVAFAFLGSTNQFSIVIDNETMFTNANWTVPSGDTLLVRVAHESSWDGTRIATLPTGVTS